jgi:hypothetical protein
MNSSRPRRPARMSGTHRRTSLSDFIGSEHDLRRRQPLNIGVSPADGQRL